MSTPTKWRHEWDALLGTEMDTVLAARFGVSCSLVSHRRLAAGIPRASRSPTAGRLRLAALPDDVFVRNSNTAIALRCGVGLLYVANERRARGIIQAARGAAPDMLLRAAVAGMLAVDDPAPGNGAATRIARVLHVSRERARQLCDDVRRVWARSAEDADPEAGA